MSDKTTSAFWTFSLSLYRMEGVAPACLTLQDHHGVDVNVMLYGLWLASQGRALDARDMTQVISAMEDWRTQVVVPLRGVRRITKSVEAAAGPGADSFAAAGVAALRDKIKAVELEAERLQQEALYALRPAAQWGQPALAAEAAAINLDAYAQALGAEFEEGPRLAMLAGFAQLPAVRT